jgi:hypothetical protein
MQASGRGRSNVTTIEPAVEASMSAQSYEQRGERISTSMTILSWHTAHSNPVLLLPAIAPHRWLRTALDLESSALQSQAPTGVLIHSGQSRSGQALCEAGWPL